MQASPTESQSPYLVSWVMTINYSFLIAMRFQCNVFAYACLCLYILQPPRMFYSNKIEKLYKSLTLRGHQESRGNTEYLLTGLDFTGKYQLPDSLEKTPGGNSGIKIVFCVESSRNIWSEKKTGNQKKFPGS